MLGNLFIFIMANFVKYSAKESSSNLTLKPKVSDSVLQVNIS